jgi:hypothetical protein
MNYSANGIIAVGMEGSEARQAENFSGFIRTYEQELIKARKDFPNDYIWPESEFPKVMERMTRAIRKRSFNKEGHAFKNTCKRLGLKYTYTAIDTFLKGY